MKLYAQDGNIAYFEFKKQLRERWGFVWPVRIGKPKSPEAVLKWCKEVDGGAEFAHSPGFEIFYFSTDHMATLFKLKWR